MRKTLAVPLLAVALGLAGCTIAPIGAPRWEEKVAHLEIQIQELQAKVAELEAKAK